MAEEYQILKLCVKAVTFHGFQYLSYPVRVTEGTDIILCVFHIYPHSVTHFHLQVIPGQAGAGATMCYASLIAPRLIASARPTWTSRVAISAGVE